MLEIPYSIMQSNTTLPNMYSQPKQKQKNHDLGNMAFVLYCIALHHTSGHLVSALQRLFGSSKNYLKLNPLF